jgi:hypothetical protein
MVNCVRFDSKYQARGDPFHYLPGFPRDLTSLVDEKRVILPVANGQLVLQ